MRWTGKRRGTKRKLGALKVRKVTKCFHTDFHVSHMNDDFVCADCGARQSMREVRLGKPWEPTIR